MAVTRLTTNGLTGTKYDIASADNYYMEPIATTLLSSGASSVTFSNIPNTYKHLQVRANVLGTAGYDLLCQFNSDTGTNYNFHYLAGNGAITGAGAGTTTAYITLANNFMQGTTIPGAAVIDILDYANTSKNKTVRALTGSDANGSGWLQLGSGLWRNTAAITSIVMYPASSQTFNTNTRFSLYGIKG